MEPYEARLDRLEARIAYLEDFLLLAFTQILELAVTGGAVSEASVRILADLATQIRELREQLRPSP